MNKILKRLTPLALSALLMVSCIEDDADVVLNQNPYALTQSSLVTAVLANSQNQDCYALNFPITVATYTEGFIVSETIIIPDNTALQAFISGLAEEDSYAIQYPFSITGFNDTEVDITGNDSFLSAVEAEVTLCAAGVNTCDVENTDFSQLYAATAGTEEFTMDTWTHEYTFSVSEGGTVCSIGYKGETATLEYLIELLDSQGTVLYTGNHVFSAAEVEYISIPTPVTLTANENYTLRRSIPNYDNGTGIGTLKNVTLPVTANGITVQQSRFYGGGGNQDPDLTKLPFIDFVFTPTE